VRSLAARLQKKTLLSPAPLGHTETSDKTLIFVK